jgi:hypothetical protein
MQDFLLAIIAATLIVLTVELSVVLYYAVIFLREMAIVARKVKSLEGSMEKKIEKLESELTLLSVKIIKALFQRINKNKK